MEQEQPNTEVSTAFIQEFRWPDPEEDVKRALEVVSCSKEHGEDLCPAAYVEYQQVSRILASNPATPAAVLDHLSTYARIPHLLERVAANTSSPGKVLSRLAHHESPVVRSAVAESANLDREILRDLARDPHTDVRFMLAENHNIPTEILDELAGDDNPYVAHRAQKTRKRLDGSLSEPAEMPTPSAADNQRTQRRMV